MINEIKVTSIAAVARSTGVCIIGIHDAMFFSHINNSYV